MNSDILIYQNQDGNIKIDVRLEEETVWLTQAQMGQLFGKDKRTISEHLGNVFQEGELDKSSTVRKFRIVQLEGSREVEREIDHYNLDVIISVGYRVKSPQGTQFRIWATQCLKEYIIKGFALNDDRFKSGNSMNYFNELQERIREIRLSERFFYQKIKDIYTTSIDYDSKDEKTLEFFKVVQNKLLWAISEQTAAELVYRRSRRQFALARHAILRQKGNRVHQEIRCKHCQKLPERRRNQVARFAGRAVFGFCRDDGAAAHSDVYGRLDQAAGQHFTTQRQRTTQPCR